MLDKHDIHSFMLKYLKKNLVKTTYLYKVKIRAVQKYLTRE